MTVEDVFRTYCLGTGADGSPGYPLIGVWLTGDELSTAAEIDASVGDFMKISPALSQRAFLYRIRKNYFESGSQCEK